jgi:hypothetical protein
VRHALPLAYTSATGENKEEIPSREKTTTSEHEEEANEEEQKEQEEETNQQSVCIRKNAAFSSVRV